MVGKVLHLSTYDAHGGAGRAAYSLHRAMIRAGIESEMWVGRKSTLDDTVIERHPHRFRITGGLDRQLWKSQRSPTKTWRSPARFGSLTAREINASDADVVNLHWVTNGFLSIEEIGKIAKPVVWSMYDMWPFCGTEHYAVDALTARWREGYTRLNRPPGESGWDLDRYAWQRKRRNWRPLHLIPASNWLAGATQASALTRGWPITRIPHVVDSDVFLPMDKGAARRDLGLSHDASIIVFLASAGLRDQRKGFDLLEDALHQLGDLRNGTELVMAGPVDRRLPNIAGLPVTWIGEVHTDAALRTLYCAGDILALPSREDNMPLTAMEAHTCGRAVVAFDTGGVPDIVVHRITGYLAPLGDTQAFANGIIEALADARGANQWGRQARQYALATWSQAVVVSDYLSVYSHVSP